VSTRVLIADDQALVRAGFRKLLESAPDIEVVGRRPTARGRRPGAPPAPVDRPHGHPHAAPGRHRGDPRLTGSTAMPSASSSSPPSGLDDYVYDALRAGASGFMLKDAPPEELLAAIEVVARGDALIAPAVTRSVIEEFVRRSPAQARRRRARRAHRPRARGARAARARAVERRDR
jgi:DNA-binding NarL/FixJ family response regulator